MRIQRIPLCFALLFAGAFVLASAAAHAELRCRLVSASPPAARCDLAGRHLLLAARRDPALDALTTGRTKLQRVLPGAARAEALAADDGLTATLMVSPTNVRLSLGRIRLGVDDNGARWFVAADDAGAAFTPVADLAAKAEYLSDGLRLWADQKPLALPPLDLNRASAALLERLPHIGPALARRLVAWRQANGPFASPEAVVQVRGIGPKTLADLLPLVATQKGSADPSSNGPALGADGAVATPAPGLNPSQQAG
ncbi:MAG TPA: helix-hairpin-helix domain-containing protein [Limnochordia bacterium]|nr:helix-hairpin-helix domain-containing protein [Limnochordia bacterium]